LETIGSVKTGDNLARLILGSAKREKYEPQDGDVIVVSQKIVSKAQGLLVDISRIKPSRKAMALSRRVKKDPKLIELILQDSERLIRAEERALVVRRREGIICLNAGVDKSNVDGPTTYTRLPEDSDKIAVKIRKDIERLSGKRIAVIIADTYSRPHRVGQTEFAIGVSGIEPIIDYRGTADLYGYELKYKYVALADEIAAAAELVIGQGNERIPVAIVRGLTRLQRTNRSGLSRKLVLDKNQDIFKDAA
jgi:coenzyme F420-0:L-glutamate ligase/coenzyme F420-1:gamma-L-glutamate ligase